jgi:hypothetical protein
MGGSRGREVLIDDIPEDSLDIERDSGFDAEDFSGENFPRNRDDFEN